VRAGVSGRVSVQGARRVRVRACGIGGPYDLSYCWRWLHLASAPRKNISPQFLQPLKSGGQQHAHVEASRHDMREITAAPALHRPVCAKFVRDHSPQGPVVRLNPSSKPYSNNCSTPEVTTPHTNSLQSPQLVPPLQLVPRT